MKAARAPRLDFGSLRFDYSCTVNVQYTFTPTQATLVTFQYPTRLAQNISMIWSNNFAKTSASPVSTVYVRASAQPNYPQGCLYTSNISTTPDAERALRCPPHDKQDDALLYLPYPLVHQQQCLQATFPRYHKLSQHQPLSKTNPHTTCILLSQP